MSHSHTDQGRFYTDVQTLLQDIKRHIDDIDFEVSPYYHPQIQPVIKENIRLALHCYIDHITHKWQEMTRIYGNRVNDAPAAQNSAEQAQKMLDLMSSVILDSDFHSIADLPLSPGMDVKLGDYLSKTPLPHLRQTCQNFINDFSGEVYAIIELYSRNRHDFTHLRLGVRSRLTRQPMRIEFGNQGRKAPRIILN